MYKCFSSGQLGFPDKSIRDNIPLAVKYGYEGIFFDIKQVSASFSPSEFIDLLVENKLKDGGFELPVEFRKDRETFEADLKTLRSCCEFAEKTGSNRCVTYLLPFSDTLDYKANFNLHKERLIPAAKILEEHGIRFGLEFVGPPSLRHGKTHEFIHDLDGINELMDAIGTSNMGYLLDVFHWDLAGQVFDDFKKIPGPEWIVMVHISDAPKGLSAEEQQDQSRELPGATGVLRIDEFMRGLSNLKYDGPVSVEPFSESLKTMPFEEAVKTAKASMDKVWPRKAGVSSGARFLSISGLSKSYRALKAVDSFSAEFEEGRIYGLIGTNGAGKTTVLNMIAGLEKPTSGSIIFQGREIAGLPPDRITRYGIGRTFQNLRLFSSMTVLDNVLAASQISRSYNLFQAMLLTPAFRNEDKAQRDHAMEFLNLFDLAGEAGAKANSLPYGHQRKLEIARALATGARLVLLDEPAAGMNPQETAELMETIVKIRDTLGVTVLLIEHDMKVVMGICEYIYAMSFGEIIDQGLPGEIIKSKRVIDVYLGGVA